MTLSKSNYIKAINCGKALYLHFHKPELRDKISPEQEAIFETGHKVGKLAQDLFPGGIDASKGEFYNYLAAVQFTQELILDGQQVIYEACFQFGECICYLDILVKKADKWYAYEVKSNTEIKPYVINDAAFQYYVISGSGLRLEDISIVYVNNQYVRTGELDVQQMFTTKSVKDIILGLQNEISSNVPGFYQIIKGDIVPKKDIGPHCSDPFNCDFIENCWKHIPDYSIFDISGLRKNRKFDLYQQGILEFGQIPDDFKLSKSQRIQVDGELFNTPYFNEVALNAFKNQLVWPLYYMDFETFSPAIPKYDGCRPYQRLPFQYSLHVQKSPGSELKHYEYLGTPQKDPRPEFIQLLLDQLGSSGSIIVYNKGFESSVLRDLAEVFPEYKNAIEDLDDRYVDLMGPFRAKDYYLPEMKGSYSIKDVLPALVPGESYEELGIHAGGEASLTYELLYQKLDPEIMKKYRHNLYEYCAQDTMAMVKIMDKLN